MYVHFLYFKGSLFVKQTFDSTFSALVSLFSKIPLNSHLPCLHVFYMNEDIVYRL
ncbi:hypothetical protein B4129_2214 [Bacillus safensis]|nr:hypothetical protein B4129_2214 [Bacillus safensis]